MIVQVGPYPEPLGGISVFVKRMKEYLDYRQIPNEVWDIGGVTKGIAGVFPVKLAYLPFKYYHRKDIRLIHYHICGKHSKEYIGLFNQIIFRKRKKILTIHGDARVLFSGKSTLLTKAINSFNAIILVRAGDMEYLKNQGVTTRILEIPAFIFPDITDTEASIPEYVADFIASHSFIIGANASGLQFHEDHDLYGIDMCIMLIKKLKDTFPDVNPGLVFCLTEVNNDRYFQQLQNLIRDNDVGNNFLFVLKRTEFYPIIKKCHLFVRPTNTDGYSVSLAEALYFRVPSLASDVVARPEGTVLFKVRNHEDFYGKTVTIMNNYPDYHHQVERLQFEDNARKLLEFYLDLMGREIPPATSLDRQQSRQSHPVSRTYSAR